MITGAIKSQIDQIWKAFWAAQITDLLFVRRVDDLHTFAPSTSYVRRLWLYGALAAFV